MCGNCFPDVQRYKLIHIPTGYSIYINRLWYMFFYGRCNLCDFQVCLLYIIIMFLLVLKYDGDNSEAKIGYAMMALEAYGCKVNHKSNYDFYRIKQEIDRKQPVYSICSF